MLFQLYIKQSNGIYCVKDFLPYGTENLQKRVTHFFFSSGNYSTLHFRIRINSWYQVSAFFHFILWPHSAVLKLYIEVIKRVILFERCLPYW